jgi:hypothetical protein
MAISSETNKRFNQALSDEFGITLNDTESDMMLKDLIGYYRLLQQLEKKTVQSMQETRNSDQGQSGVTPFKQ